MLLFLDESYERMVDGRYRMAYGGFAVDERRYRGLVAAVYQAKQRFNVQHMAALTEAERIELTRTRLMKEGPPERAEIKANKLLGTRQQTRLAVHG